MSDKAVLCIANSVAQAERIANELRRSGFSSDDISVLLPDKGGMRDFAHEQTTKSPEGAVTGASAGGLLGGGLGWLMSIGSLAIPGVGPFIAAGPIMAALAGAAIGAAAGGLTGALVGLGVPEYEAKQYAGRLESGNVLISVHVKDGTGIGRVKQIFHREGAEDISYTGEASVPSSERPVEPDVASHPARVL